LLDQQLVAVGEVVLDVPPKLAARVRLLDNTHSDKTDSHDARSAAIVAVRNGRLRQINREDHRAVLRLLAKRHHDLIAARNRAFCRLHTTVCCLVEGHLPRRLQAERAAKILTGIHATTAIDVERKTLARDLLGEVRRLDRELHDHGVRIRQAVEASGSTITQLYGVGPIVAAYLLGYSGDVSRFPSARHYARVRSVSCWSGRHRWMLARGRSSPPGGLGCLLAQQLLARGERVVEDHVTVLRLLAKAHLDKGRARSRACSRLHALVNELVPGGIGKEIHLNQARSTLAGIEATSVVQRQRPRQIRGIGA
jgi:hypothetical protein